MDWRKPHTKLILGWNKCLRKETKLHQRKADYKQSSNSALLHSDVKKKNPFWDIIGTLTLFSNSVSPNL